eukprot:2707646-Amphidinium_carterae.1
MLYALGTFWGWGVGARFLDPEAVQQLRREPLDLYGLNLMLPMAPFSTQVPQALGNCIAEQGQSQANGGPQHLQVQSFRQIHGPIRCHPHVGQDVQTTERQRNKTKNASRFYMLLLS